jgi:hypothetical protein
MTNVKFLILILFTSAIISSCISKKKDNSPHPSEYIIVSLEIEDELDICKIVLCTDDGTDTIPKVEDENKTNFKLKAKQLGEGNYSICIFFKTDTLCSQKEYVEGGYRPKLKLKNKKFEVIDWF